jgi:uncharacterized protein YyaL (SSP411 family)
MTENQLRFETSPYLLQHASNPVYWRPWGPNALAEASTKNKPILLSVGYAACHWCHVMARESFENPEIAQLMNTLFINIKVDREERPDIDEIYQHALSLLDKPRGWPLTMFLNPTGEPFWGGTYFPPTPRHGQPGFAEILKTVSDYWEKSPSDILKNVSALKTGLAKLTQTKRGPLISLSTAETAALRLNKEFDKIHGGIGSAPKFPNLSVLELIWRTYIRCNHSELRKTTELTLERMSQGGIFDHLGGGFARYSTDPEWLAPHFEKMLYDNAQHIETLGLCWKKSQNPLFESRLKDTIQWLINDMTCEGGAFAATLDADSQGEEGKFYVWSAGEIEQVLGPDAAFFMEAYDVSEGGNWKGKTILNRLSPQKNYGEKEEKTLEGLRHRLLLVRNQRPRPRRDDKILADWNGLAIAALAPNSIVFNEMSWLEHASDAFEFVTKNMIRDQRLYHSWCNGSLKTLGTLDDYACLIKGALALFETTGRREYLKTSMDLTHTLNKHYWDPDGGGYYFIADDSDGLIVRPKRAEDHSTPAGNSVMLKNLARLYYLTGDETFRIQAEEIISAFSGHAMENFFPHAALFSGVEFFRNAVQVFIVSSDYNDAALALQSVCLKSCDPNIISSIYTETDNLPKNHPAHGKNMLNGRPTAFVCRNERCSLPITTPAELSAHL